MDQARARHRAYALLGRLVWRGPDAELAPVVRALPALADVLPDEDADAWAAEHQRATGWEVFPYQSAYLSRDGLLGGAEEARVRAAYAEGGFAPKGEGDHLGLELAYLAHLCAAEVEAAADGVSVADLQALQRRFLAEHVLRWLPAVVVAFERAGCPLYARVSAVALELAVSHGAAVEVAPSLPGAPIGLDDPETGIAALARAWVVPAVSGWALSRCAIGRVARTADVPVGFGSRAHQLEAAWRAAVDHRRLGGFLAGLAAEAEAWQRRYAELAEVGAPVCAWVERLRDTQEAVARVRGVTVVGDSVR